MQRLNKEQKCFLGKMNMRKSIFFVILFAVCLAVGFSTTGCTEKKAAADSLQVDSFAADTVIVDSVEELIAETPLPKTVDELFDDFVFNFCGNRKFQFKRIHFPLPVKQGNQTTFVQKKQWKMERLFMKQDFYTLILDNARQLEWSKDTAIKHVVVEKIYLDDNTVKQYIFDRLQGQWMMTAIDVKAIGNSKNASFLDFYKHFVADSAFQISSIHNPLTFVGPDPDDDFKTITGSLEPDQWSAFAPELPRNLIYNILYGQKYTESTQKIFMIRGIANGFETELTFRRKDGKWKLVKLST